MCSNAPLISVVIPTYNRAKDLKRALISVISQSYQNWEVIIIDNNSSDNTDEIIRDFADQRIFTYKINNLGIIAMSRNMGIEKAKGEIIAFLDSDDWWTPNKLEESVSVLNQNFDFVYHDLLIIRTENKKLNRRTVGARSLEQPIYDDLILNGSVIPNSSVVVKKRLLQKIGGLSEERELIAAEDYDCWLRLSLVTEKFYCIPKTLGYYWQGLTNNSNPKAKNINLKRLQELYFDPYLEKHQLETPTWILYQNLRTQYLLKNFRQVTPILKKLLKRPLPFSIKFKLIYMLVKLNINRHLIFF